MQICGLYNDCQEERRILHEAWRWQEALIAFISSIDETGLGRKTGNFAG